MSAPRPPEQTRSYGVLGFAWAAVIWASSPLVPVVRARFNEPGGIGFDLVVQILLGASVAVLVAFVWLHGSPPPKLRVRRLGALAGLLIGAGIAALLLAPPDPRSRVVELAHFVQFGTLGGIAFLAHARRLPLAHALVQTLLLVLAAGIVDELVQHALASRYGEVRDVVLNVVAGGLGPLAP